MARPLRIEYSGAIYHITCRMVGEKTDHLDGMKWPADKRLFRDDADRARFLEQLEDRVQQFHIRLFLFVLMTNHFHLVFETPEANCSKFMQSLLTAYTVYYNLRHRRHGHLLDGRFKAKLVAGDDYLLALSRYVHLNPVQIGAMKDKPITVRIEALRSWRWSSYPSYIGKRKALHFVACGPLLAEMSGRPQEWPKRYREFVESGLSTPDDGIKAALKESPRSVGGDGFRAWIDELYQQRVATYACPEDVAFRHTTEPLAPNEVLRVLAEVLDVEPDAFRQRRYKSPLRAVAARMLIQYAAQSQRAVAALLEMGSGSAVCKQLSSLPEKLSEDQRLCRRVQQAAEHLLEIKTARNQWVANTRT